MEDELKHYGVIGMKWGVHRARAYANSSDPTKREKATHIAETHLDKAATKMGVLQRRGAKLESRYNRLRNQVDYAVPMYKHKLAKHVYRTNHGLFRTDFSVGWHGRRASSLNRRVAHIELEAARAKKRLEKNRRIQSIYAMNIEELQKIVRKKEVG